MEIKGKLKKIIQETGHHPFLFVGAGRRYMNTEKWDELLRYFCKDFSNDEFEFVITNFSTLR